VAESSPVAGAASVNLARKLGSLYGRIASTYLQSAPSLLLLAVAVFIPLGLLDALATEITVDSLDLRHSLELLAVIAATAAVTVTGLLGEVFYSGTVAIYLTHPEGEKPPGVREIARRLEYRRLILVDIAYVAAVIVGLVLFVIPGILVFVWFALAGPVVEIEGRSVRGALSRSLRLVRGNFWLVFLVMAPVELVGDGLTDLIAGLVHNLLGHSFFATWMAESVSNIAFTPIFAVAAVLLTLDLIGAKGGDARLNPSPIAVTT
jgi:hypothetical protein